MMLGTVITTILFHITASSIALCKWIRVPKYRLIIPLSILLAGLVYPFTAGILTSMKFTRSAFIQFRFTFDFSHEIWGF